MRAIHTHQLPLCVVESQPGYIKFVKVIATDLVRQLVHLVEFVVALAVRLILGCVQILAWSEDKHINLTVAVGPKCFFFILGFQHFLIVEHVMHSQ